MAKDGSDKAGLRNQGWEGGIALWWWHIMSLKLGQAEPRPAGRAGK